MRWPYSPLRDYLGTATLTCAHRDTWKGMSISRPMTNEMAGDICGVSTRSVNRWVRDGLTDRRADEVAARLGVHPTAIWPDWCDIEDVA